MGTRERREREKQQRREAIVSAARETFWKRGYEGTTMPRIAEAAELAPGTLYLYFPSKDALYAELLIQGYETLIQRLRSGIPEDAPPREQADALIELFIHFAQDCPEYFDIIFFVVQREGRDARDVLPEREQLERLDARQNACKQIVVRVLQRANPAAGEAELRTTVDAMWSMLVGMVMYFLKTGPEEFGNVAGEAKRLLLRGVFGEK